MKTIKNIIDEKFSKFARLILRLTAPLVIIQALVLIYYIFSRNAYELFTASHVIYGMAEGILVSLVLSIGGCLLMDRLERRKKQE